MRYISLQDLAEYKTAYGDAVSANKKTFVFHDMEVVTNFAKYQIEYMEIKLNEKEKKN